MKRELQKVSADGHRHICEVKSFFPECYPKCFCCLDQVSYNGFNKKSRGTDIFWALFCKYDLERTLLLEKLYLDA